MDDEAALGMCSIFSDVKTAAGSLQKGQKHLALRRCKSDKPYICNENSEFELKRRKRSAHNICLKNVDKENMDPGNVAKSPEIVLSNSTSDKQRRPLKCANIRHFSVGSSRYDNDDSFDSVQEDFAFDSNNNQGYNSVKPQVGTEGCVTTPPPSPTWNLKILCNAVSPEIRRMQQEKENGCEEERSSTASSATTLTNRMVSPCDENSHDYNEFASSQDSTLSLELEVITSRKDKSLGRLCDKFLMRYPEYPDAIRIDICLDEVARDLGVERRRIYDIVNVLESVEIVSRAAKNKYAWHGKTNLPHTLLKLKMLAKKEKMQEQIMKIREQEMAKKLNRPATSPLPVFDPKDDDKSEESTQTVLQRKEKSLGIMSQKFLMLFLVSKPKTVNLELSAKILIGDDALEASKFKTKIRRLYDIANILSSLKLIKKIHVTEIRGRKPAFQYIGPDVDDVYDVDACCNDGCHRPSSRHSLLDCIRNENVQSIMHGFRPIRPAGSILPAELRMKLGCDSGEESGSRSFPRHTSLDEICKVIEQERNLLKGSTSEPTSPSRKLSFEDITEHGSKMAKFAVPLSMSKHLSFDDHLAKDGCCTVTKVIYRPQAVSAQSHLKNILHTPTPGTKPTETIILSNSGEAKSINGQNIPLSRTDFEKIVHSLRLAKSSAQRQIHFSKPPEERSTPFTILGRSLLRSPDFEKAACNEASPIPGSIFRTRILKRNITDIVEGDEKRMKLEIPDTSETISWNKDSSPAPEVKIGLRRLNSMPVSSANAPSSVRYLPQIIVRCINRSAAATPPTGENINMHVSSDQAAGMGEKATPLLKNGTRKLLVENVMFSPHSLYTSQLRSGNVSNGFPMKIISNPITPDLATVAPTNLSSVSSSFTPPTTPKNHPLFSTPLAGHPENVQTGVHIVPQPSSLRKVLTAAPASLPQSHNSSPFKVVIPSTAKQPTTTYLLKVPSSKLTKTATM